MNCRGVLDVLSDYLEGQAGSAVCKKIEEHLKGCERCRMHIDTMRKMITLYKKWRDDPIPEDVQMRLRSIVARECALRGLESAAGTGLGRAPSVSPRRKTGKKPVSRTKGKSPSKKSRKSTKRRPRRH
jgi:anti-sigma factor RsiW